MGTIRDSHFPSAEVIIQGAIIRAEILVVLRTADIEEEEDEETEMTNNEIVSAGAGDVATSHPETPALVLVLL